MSNFAKSWLVCIALLPSLVAMAQTLKEDTPLFDKPEGAKLASGKAGAAIKIKRRQGFWVEIDLEGKSGWVQLAKINLSGGSGGPIAIDTGRTSTGNIVSTSSARGLSAKDLLNGKPDRQAVARLERFVIDDSAVARFRSDGDISVLREKVVLTAQAQPPSTKAPASQRKDDEGFDPPRKKSDDW